MLEQAITNRGGVAPVAPLDGARRTAREFSLALPARVFSVALLASVLVSLLMIFCVFFPAPSSAKIVKNTFELCLECHPKAAEITKKGVVHKPVVLGLCTACHNPHASKHSGLLGFEKGQLCYSCHDPKRGFQDVFVHEPVSKGQCLACHDAHSTDIPRLLTKPLDQGCFSCHPRDELFTGQIVHPEAARGNCTACHDPHASSWVGLLAADRKAICAKCHDASGDEYARSHMGFDVAGTDCLDCHTPHSSETSAMLKASLHKPFGDKNCDACHEPGSRETSKRGIALCTGCHSASMPGFNKINSHLVSDTTDNICLSCHNPHASDRKNLIKGKLDRVCYACHDDTKRHAAESNSTHPKLEGCTVCHTAHASNNRFFLDGGDETCSTDNCHPTQGVFTHPVGEKIIDPRSKLPMNCVTCHNPMGSINEPILRLDKERELCIQCHQM